MKYAPHDFYYRASSVLKTYYSHIPAWKYVRWKGHNSGYLFGYLGEMFFRINKLYSGTSCDLNPIF
jgi:hypothetical protein